MIRGFHVPPGEVRWGRCLLSTGRVWATRMQTIIILPPSSCLLAKRVNLLRLFRFTIFITGSDIFTLPAI